MDKQIYYLITLVIVSWIISMWAIRKFINFAHKNDLLDVPNERSSHTILTPRGGGIVIVMQWVITLLLLACCSQLDWFYLKLYLPGLLIISAIGFIDDKYQISPIPRLICHFIAATLTVYVLGDFLHLDLIFLNIHLGVWGKALVVFLIVYSINIFNFMDGADGVAGIESIFIFIVGSVLFLLSGGSQLATILLSLAAIVAGFLVWNWPQAKVFMGDAGSGSLGYIIMVTSLIGIKIYHIPILIWVLLYALFLFDTTITLVRRLIRGHKIYKAHRLHAYQRYCQAGYSHADLLKWVIVINIFLSSFALLAYFKPQWLYLYLLIAIALLGFCYLQVEKKISMDAVK